MKFLIIDLFFHRDSKQFSSLAFHITCMCMNGTFFTLFQNRWILYHSNNTIRYWFRLLQSQFVSFCCLHKRGASPSNEIKYSKFDWQVKISQIADVCYVWYLYTILSCKNACLLQHHSVIYGWFIFCYNCVKHVDVLCIPQLYRYGNIVVRLYRQSPF